MKSDTDIKSIPTFYSSVMFRSRMEARCAHLFDKLGWKWKYEPFSVLLPNGIPYTPDFWIENPSMIVECRGYETVRSRSQIDAFIALVERHLGFEVPNGEGECIDTFIMIGPSDVNIYTCYDRDSFAGAPASARWPYEKRAGCLYKCRCGWSPLNSSQWCPNCEEIASAAMMLSVSDGILLINGRPVESL